METIYSTHVKYTDEMKKKMAKKVIAMRSTRHTDNNYEQKKLWELENPCCLSPLINTENNKKIEEKNMFFSCEM